MKNVTEMTTTEMLLHHFDKFYDELYLDHEYERYIENTYSIDEMENVIFSDEMKPILKAFIQERQDILTSDREIRAFWLACESLKSEIEWFNLAAKVLDAMQEMGTYSIENIEEIITTLKKKPLIIVKYLVSEC